MHRSDGFTLVEVLVTIALFGIVAMGLAGGFIMQIRSNTQSALRVQAIAAAQQVLDRLRTEDPSTFPATGSSAPENVTLDGKTFSVTVSYCQVTSFCIATTTRHLRAVVSYKNRKVYEVDTVFSQLK
jgi:prepilin-type N-terminal cleavage/methylation domain-containing protein